MKIIKILIISLFCFFINNLSLAKNPSSLIIEIVDEASNVLSSSDPVESKIIKLNDIAERNVDINGIGMNALGKYRKAISDDQKTKYKKLFKSYFLKSFSLKSESVELKSPVSNSRLILPGFSVRLTSTILYIRILALYLNK